MRQDSFKETVFRGEKSSLIILAQLVTSFLFLRFCGIILTHHFNSGSFVSDLIGRLYQVKSSSVSKVSAKGKLTAEQISELHDKVDTTRNSRMHAHILAWR